jgi:uncharacterized protein (TIGR00369 family)
MAMTGAGVGVASIEVAKALTGLEFLQRIVDGRLPAPPITATLDFAIIEVGKGFAVFRGRPAFNHYNPMGAVHGGYAATLLDSCMGCAVHSTLEAGEGQTTLEMKINLVRAISDETGEVRAEGRLLSRGRRVGTAEGRLLDSDGKLLAHGTTTCMIFPL